MKMELETINRLFLELSQFSTARTAREILYENALDAIVDCPQQPNNTTEMRLRLIAKDALKTGAKLTP